MIQSLLFLVPRCADLILWLNFWENRRTSVVTGGFLGLLVDLQYLVDVVFHIPAILSEVAVSAGRHPLTTLAPPIDVILTLRRQLKLDKIVIILMIWLKLLWETYCVGILFNLLVLRPLK